MGQAVEQAVGRLRRLLMALLLAWMTGLCWGPAPAMAQEMAQDAEATAFLHTFQEAWSTGDVVPVLALFAQDAVIELNYQGPGGSYTYRGGGVGPMSLRDGVINLLEMRAQPDLATSQTFRIVFGGLPTTSVRWSYRHPGLGLPIPPEVGTDDIVLRAGQILSYTRTPDGSNEAARAQAIDRVAVSLATQTARATERAGAQGTVGPPSTQERGAPAAGPWILAVGLVLIGVVVLAAFKRPTEL